MKKAYALFLMIGLMLCMAGCNSAVDMQADSTAVASGSTGEPGITKSTNETKAPNAVDGVEDTYRN